ncbi:MAG: hypothetical protein ACRD41_06385, partial [Candidatus Acidiferrales bacterium]
FYLVLVIGIGLGMHVWSQMIHQVYSMRLDSGTVVCMLLALSLLSILGLRYPLKMLPLLFWELTWKASWLISAVSTRLTITRSEGHAGATSRSAPTLPQSQPTVRPPA